MSYRVGTDVDIVNETNCISTMYYNNITVIEILNRRKYLAIIYLFLGAPVRDVALPELPGETLHITDHGILVLETGVPAQRPVSEHPELAVHVHGHGGGRRAVLSAAAGMTTTIIS